MNPRPGRLGRENTGLRFEHFLPARLDFGEGDREFRQSQEDVKMASLRRPQALVKAAKLTVAPRAAPSGLARPPHSLDCRNRKGSARSAAIAAVYLRRPGWRSPDNGCAAEWR